MCFDPGNSKNASTSAPLGGWRETRGCLPCPAASFTFFAADKLLEANKHLISGVDTSRIQSFSGVFHLKIHSVLRYIPVIKWHKLNINIRGVVLMLSSAVMDHGTDMVDVNRGGFPLLKGSFWRFYWNCEWTVKSFETTAFQMWGRTHKTELKLTELWTWTGSISNKPRALSLFEMGIYVLCYMQSTLNSNTVTDVCWYVISKTRNRFRGHFNFTAAVSSCSVCGVF